MYTRLHGATFQMTVIFIVNAVIISVLTPRDDGTAVQSDIERQYSTADANSAEVW
jgi:preprotein translocase subunit SecG